MTFDSSPLPSWQMEVETWEWLPDPTATAGGWIKSGPCPRCRHTFTARLAPGARALKARAFRRTADKMPMWTLVTCDCGSGHLGRPPDAVKRGCGQSGWVTKPSITGAIDG